MFTGIIEAVGKLTQLEQSKDHSVKIRLLTSFTDLVVGESVAINGVCLTVTETDRSGAAQFFLNEETLKRTNLGALSVGSVVNLERALLLSTRLSGHMVQGHVDGVAKLSICEAGSDGQWKVGFRLARTLAPYVIDKGSITLNGISLTINQIRDGVGAEGDTEIELQIIPHTWVVTNLSSLRLGDPVNVEVDLVAKYLHRFRSLEHVTR